MIALRPPWPRRAADGRCIAESCGEALKNFACSLIPQAIGRTAAQATTEHDHNDR